MIRCPSDNFSSSRRAKGIALLVKADRPSSSMIIEKWQERPQPRRTGATTTRAISHLNPQPTQVIAETGNKGRGREPQDEQRKMGLKAAFVQ
ncbi:unnamed protein product, partial [Clonostachys solani]